MSQPRIPKLQVAAFGVGHVLNDLCASIWFSYLLVFFHGVLQFSNTMAGNILLVGQIADGIATPFVGFESDNLNVSCRYGKRKTWHLVGTICVTLCFPLIFIQCIGCNEQTSETAQFIYYAPLVVIFQFGWAATQINHLALIPDLTSCDHESVILNSLRYAFTVISSVSVYGIAWAFLNFQCASSNQITPEDAPAFRNLTLTCVGMGVCFSLVFHIFLKETRTTTTTPPSSIPEHDESYQNATPPSSEKSHSNGYQQIETIGESNDDPVDECSTLLLSHNTNNDDGLVTACVNSIALTNDDEDDRQVWYHWFFKRCFYIVAVVYMCTRLVVNLSQVYIPMYLTETLMLDKTYIALIPLVMYLSSFVATMTTHPVSKCLSQEVVYILGACFTLTACVALQFIPEKSLLIFGVAILLGFGNSIILVMSLSMTARLIGNDAGSGAFVYGAMSLTDKLSNGAAVEIIQILNPCLCDCPLCGEYFRSIMSYVIGAIMICGITATIVLKLLRINSTRRQYEPL